MKIFKGEVVERVENYKYLGVIFDQKLDWVKNSKRIQSLFREFINSFCITAWGGNIRVKQKSAGNTSIKRCNKLLKTNDFQDIDQALFCECQRKYIPIIKDKTHPLFSFSSRSDRVIHIKTRTNRHFNSFLPMAISNN